MNPETDDELRARYLQLGAAFYLQMVRPQQHTVRNDKLSVQSAANGVARGAFRSLADVYAPGTVGELANALSAASHSAPEVQLGLTELQLLNAATIYLTFDMADGHLAGGCLASTFLRAAGESRLRWVEKRPLPSEIRTRQRIAEYVDVYRDVMLAGSTMPLAWMAHRFARGAPERHRDRLLALGTEHAIGATAQAAAVLRASGFHAQMVGYPGINFEAI